MGYHGQVLSLDDLVQDSNKLEEGFSTCSPKHRHVDRHTFHVLLTRSIIDVYFQGVRLVHHILSYRLIWIVGYQERHPAIIENVSDL